MLARDVIRHRTFHAGRVDALHRPGQIADIVVEADHAARRSLGSGVPNLFELAVADFGPQQSLGQPRPGRRTERVVDRIGAHVVDAALEAFVRRSDDGEEARVRETARQRWRGTQEVSLHEQPSWLSVGTGSRVEQPLASDPLEEAHEVFFPQAAIAGMQPMEPELLLGHVGTVEKAQVVEVREVECGLERVGAKRLALVAFEEFGPQRAIEVCAHVVLGEEAAERSWRQTPEPQIREQRLQKARGGEAWIVLEVASQLRAAAAPGADLEERGADDDRVELAAVERLVEPPGRRHERHESDFPKHGEREPEALAEGKARRRRLFGPCSVQVTDDLGGARNIRRSADRKYERPVQQP